MKNQSGLFLLILVLTISSCEKTETPPNELTEVSVSGPSCAAAYDFIEFGSNQPIYSEECPSCEYVFEVTNDATIIENTTDHSVEIKVGVEDFQVNVKIKYDGGETNTIVKNVTVEEKDAFTAFENISYDVDLSVLSSFTLNNIGYILAKTTSDIRIYKFYWETNKWQALKVTSGLFNQFRSTRPNVLGTSDFYFVDDQNNLLKYDISANTFSSDLGSTPVANAKINYAYNGKFYSGSSSSNDSIFEYNPINAIWTSSYKIDAGLAGGAAKYTYAMDTKAYIFLNTGGTFVLDYASQSFTPITGIEYNYTTTAIFELYGNLHFVNLGDISQQKILNTSTNSVSAYTPFINTCSVPYLDASLFHYVFFSTDNKGIAIKDNGDVFHFNPNY